MSAYETYKWERETFPNQHQIMIQPQYRIALTAKLASAFKIRGVDTLLRCGSERGWCRKTFWGWQIVLPRYNEKCSLATIIHELSHAFADQNEKISAHHSKKFKTALIKLIVESKKMLPSIFREIRHEQELEKLKLESVMQKEIIKAKKSVVIKEFKKSREYRIVKLKERIKRLERKQKSIGTRLKSAKRSLGMLERLESKSLTPNHVPQIQSERR